MLAVCCASVAAASPIGTLTALLCLAPRASSSSGGVSTLHGKSSGTLESYNKGKALALLYCSSSCALILELLSTLLHLFHMIHDLQPYMPSRYRTNYCTASSTCTLTVVLR